MAERLGASMDAQMWIQGEVQTVTLLLSCDEGESEEMRVDVKMLFGPGGTEAEDTSLDFDPAAMRRALDLLDAERLVEV